jgi:L-threonylcarbamoyladenylate synthase
MCTPTKPDAIRAIYEMKQRPADRRLPIIVADGAQVRSALPLAWSDSAEALSARFWPGALTIACGVTSGSCEWLAGRDEAAVRAPAHPLIQSLARELGPLLMTSANRHGADTAHTADGALGDLASPPALAVDGGTLSGASSTLVNVNLATPRVERDGAIPRAAIAEVLTLE